jgi:hypothetical protein
VEFDGVLMVGVFLFTRRDFEADQVGIGLS